MASIGKGIGKGPARIPCLAALALVPVLLGVVLGLMEQDAGTQDRARGGFRTALTDYSADQALAAWEALWSRIDSQGSAALRPAQIEPGQRPAGDTVFMRYPNLWTEIDPQARTAFQLAAASSDPERKLALLAPLTHHPEPRIRLRVYLEQGRIARRREDCLAAAGSARRALAIDGIPERLKADAWLILADCAWRQGHWDESEAALDQAIAADPGFWDARRLRLELLARRLEEGSSPTAVCLDRTRRLIEDLGALPALAEDRTQFRDLADRLARAGTTRTSALALVMGLGYLWAGDQGRAQATLALAEQLQGHLPTRCESEIRARIAYLLNTAKLAP